MFLSQTFLNYICTQMQNFYQLNKSKVRFAFVFISLLSTGITLAILFIGGLFSTNSNVENLITLLGSAIFWPSFILTITYIAYLYKQRRRNKVLAKTPFDRLSELGFSNYPLNLEDKWQFTEMIPSVIWKGYTVLLDLEPRNMQYQIKLLALVENSKIDEKRFNELSAYFKKKQMDFDFGGVALFLQPKEITELSQLQQELDKMIVVLEKEFFTPATTRLL